jgi:hypothetical protein
MYSCKCERITWDFCLNDVEVVLCFLASLMYVYLVGLLLALFSTSCIPIICFCTTVLYILLKLKCIIVGR